MKHLKCMVKIFLPLSMVFLSIPITVIQLIIMIIHGILYASGCTDRQEAKWLFEFPWVLHPDFWSWYRKL